MVFCCCVGEETLEGAGSVAKLQWISRLCDSRIPHVTRSVVVVFWEVWEGFIFFNMNPQPLASCALYASIFPLSRAYNLARHDNKCTECVCMCVCVCWCAAYGGAYGCGASSFHGTASTPRALAGWADLSDCAANILHPPHPLPPPFSTVRSNPRVAAPRCPPVCLARKRAWLRRFPLTRYAGAEEYNPPSFPFYFLPAPLPPLPRGSFCHGRM